MGNEDAFPNVRQYGNGTLDLVGGLTKREYFAGLAMQKIARSTLAPELLKVRAQIAVAHADALIAELSRRARDEGD